MTEEERNGTVENAKTRLLKRITNKVLTGQQASMCPVRILSVGVDAYTDSKGKKHPSAFIEYRNEKGDKRLETRPEEWEKRVECFVREKKKLLKLGATGPTVVHVRLFYNGWDGLLQPSYVLGVVFIGHWQATEAGDYSVPPSGHPASASTASWPLSFTWRSRARSPGE